MQVLSGDEDASSASGMEFLFRQVLRQGAVGALWRLDRDQGNSGCLGLAGGGV